MKPSQTRAQKWTRVIYTLVLLSFILPVGYLIYRLIFWDEAAAQALERTRADYALRSFYYTVPHWDVFLHAFSSLMAGSFGFMVVALLNRNERVPIHLSPFFVALFAFCFAVTIGAVWEIYEFSFDGLLGLNMQKFMTGDGEVLVGRAALTDTMKDIIVDCLGALTASVAGYISLKNGRGWASDMIAQHSQKRDQKNAK